MSFNSFPYLFAFLPAVFLVYWLLGIGGRRSPQFAWLVLASLGYYGLVFYLDRGLPGWQPMLIWFAWLLGALAVNDVLGWLLRRHPAGWLLALAIAINVGLLWAYKFGLHPLYYAYAIVVAGANGMVWAWMSGGRPRWLFRLVGMVTANLALWGWLFIAAWAWAWLADRPVAEIDPFGVTGPLARDIAIDGPTWEQVAVLASLLLFPVTLFLCWAQRGVRWPAIFGGLVGAFTVAIATAFAAVASLYGIPGLGPIPLRVLDYSMTFGMPVSPTLTDILLPLGLSFMMLQHIGFLVDCHAGRVENHSPLKFGLFTLFFAQLPAGPILKWQELEPQMRPNAPPPDHIGNLRIGIGLIILGLFKKVVIADNLDDVVDPLFAAATRGDGLNLLEAWGAAIGFTLQLYFDLSGYADMAIGAARLFGIRIPANFNAPLRAPSIMDFWRRWHITLTRWFFDHIQRPLARWRRGHDWKAVTLVIGMLAMGLWHDFAWTFLLWGGLHGVFLVINYSWVRLRRAIGAQSEITLFIWRWPMVLITFAAVTLSFVPFRADDLDTAVQMMATMVGTGSWVLPREVWLLFDAEIQNQIRDAGWQVGQVRYIGLYELAWGLALLAFVWFMPSSTHLLRIANRLVGADDEIGGPAPVDRDVTTGGGRQGAGGATPRGREAA